MRSICWGLLIAALATAIGAQDVVNPSVVAVCPAGLSGTAFVRGQSCYEFNGEQVTWVQARTYCHQRDGRLVSITDADLQAWLSSTAARLWPTQKGVWIGLNDRSIGGDFVWDNYGTAEHRISYSHWASGYPSNGALSGDCVQMRSDYGWQWVENKCNIAIGYIYKYICEYRAVRLNVTVTTVGLPVITSVAGVTLSVATDYSFAFLTSSDFTDVTHGAGAMAGKNDVTLPLSVSAAVVVVVVALVALAVVIWRRQQRSRPPKDSAVLWTRTGGDEGFMVGNPMYGDSTQLTMDQTSVTQGRGSDGASGRPVSNVYADMSSAVSVVNKQKEDVVDHWLSNRDTEPTYAEPLMQEPSAAIAAEPTPYHHYTYIDTATVQKLQQPGTSVDDTASTDKKPVSVFADPGQQYSHAQQVNGSRSTQDGYEPFVSQWTPYENVQKPDA